MVFHAPVGSFFGDPVGPRTSAIEPRFTAVFKAGAQDFLRDSHSWRGGQPASTHSISSLRGHIGARPMRIGLGMRPAEFHICQVRREMPKISAADRARSKRGSSISGSSRTIQDSFKTLARFTRWACYLAAIASEHAFCEDVSIAAQETTRPCSSQAYSLLISLRQTSESQARRTKNSRYLRGA